MRRVGRHISLFILILSLWSTNQCAIAQDYSNDIIQAKINSEKAMQGYLGEVKKLNANPEVTGISLAPEAILASQQAAPSSGERRPLPSLMIFISFSMPEQSIRNWVITAKNWHATLVIRGLIDNSFKKTLLALREITKDNVGGISLNPMAFHQFQIDKVPAIVVIKDDFYQGDGEYAPPQAYDVVYGDVTLNFALNQIITKQGVSIIQAEKLLKQHGQSRDA